MLYDTLKKVGYLDGQRCYFMAGEFLPATVYCDANVFEKMNVELPPQDWKWEDMLDLIDKLADPSQGYWGYFNGMYSLVTGGPIALTDNAIGEFGWNGEAYDFASGWVESIERQNENLRLGKTLNVTSEEYLALNLGDEWGGQTGHVGIVTDAFWTLNNIYSKPISTDRGIKMVPYNPPVGADTENAGQLAFLDFYSISYTCEHPREAYELAKFLTWGKEGWLERIKLFPELTWESTGEKAYDVPNCLPMITDEEVVDAYVALMPDLGYWNDWAAFMDGIQNPVTWGSRSIPGFASFVNNYYHGSDYNGTVGIEAAIAAGTVDPYDYTDKLAEAGRQYYDEAMAVFYGVYGQPE
jgi:multiple sugar transport system substrate-binding protein